MPRKQRCKSLTGVYHIILRGINRQTIFIDNEDNEKFLQVVAETIKISGFKLYAYCLMGNHIHFLLKEEGEDLCQIFKRIGARYVYWYNAKYGRIGHLFQDRFRSEAVEDEAYFVTALKYIHQNPVKAGLCDNPASYKWSSYKAYMGDEDITDTTFAFNLASRDQLIKDDYGKEAKCVMDIENSRRLLTDPELINIAKTEFDINPTIVQSLDKKDRDVNLIKLLSLEGITKRQLSRITGISENIIWKVGR